LSGAKGEGGGKLRVRAKERSGGSALGGTNILTPWKSGPERRGERTPLFLIYKRKKRKSSVASCQLYDVHAREQRERKFNLQSLGFYE